MSPERALPLDDFLRSTEPAYKESRLLPYWEEIRAARSRKYTLSQIRHWLNQNGVEISIQGLSRFIIVQTSRDNEADSTAAPERHREDLKAKFDSGALTAPVGRRKDQREQTAAQFIRDDTNSVLNILKEQTK